MFFANCNALLFRHQSSFAKKVTQRIYTKKETGGTPEALVYIFAESFVGEGDDGIVPRGAQSRIDCAGRRAKNGEENRAKNPLIGDGDLQCGDSLREDGFGQKRESDAGDASDNGESQRFAQQELRDTRACKSECLQDADFARAFEDEGVHVQEDDEKTDDDADADHRLDEGFERGEVRGIHERYVFGDRADTVVGLEFEDFGASGFCIAFAAHVEDGDTLFRARNILGGFKRNKEASAFAVRDDAADSESVIHKCDLVTDFEMARLRNDVVGEGFVGRFERAAGTEQESFAEGVKALVVNAVDDDEVFLVHQTERGSDFTDARERGNLLAKRFLHNGAGEREENRSVGRLHEDIGADALDAFAPLAHDAVRKSNNHKDKNHLNGDGENTEDGAKRTRGEIPGDHAKRRKLCVV